MYSKDQLRTELSNIANNLNLTGDNVDLVVNELAYSLYHEQFEISNTMQESNLSTAYLLNSKIRNCMNVMYPVYRGKNVRVKMMIHNNSILTASKFDVLYSSNTFKVYAETSINLPVPLSTSPNELIGIISTKDLYDATISVTTSNKYYIDYKIDNSVVSNLSEELQVFISGVEVSSTRNFFDFMQLPSTSDTVFVLTIPDYGIRLFKRNYFTVGTSVRVKALAYTTIDELNSDEVSKICPPSANIVEYDANATDWITTSISIENIVKRTTTSDHLNDNGMILQANRDNSKSLLQTANHYSRLQSRIVSNSDVNLLFNEYFIDQISASINWFDASTISGTSNSRNTLYIFYLPKVNYDTITTAQMADFNTIYGSYFINNTPIAVIGELYPITVTLTLSVLNSSDLSSTVEAIFNNYSNQLNNPLTLTTDDSINVFNPKQAEASITKLSSVDFIESIYYSYSLDLPDKYVTRQINNISVNVPTYYQFIINITYNLINNGTVS